LSSVRRLIQRRSGERAIYTEGRSGRTVIDADLTAAVARWDPVVAELGEGAVVALSSMDPLVFATTYLGLLAAGATALVADGALSMVAGGGRARAVCSCRCATGKASPCRQKRSDRCTSAVPA